MPETYAGVNKEEEGAFGIVALAKGRYKYDVSTQLTLIAPTTCPFLVYMHEEGARPASARAWSLGAVLVGLHWVCTWKPWKLPSSCNCQLQWESLELPGELCAHPAAGGRT